MLLYHNHTCPEERIEFSGFTHWDFLFTDKNQISFIPRENGVHSINVRFNGSHTTVSDQSVPPGFCNLVHKFMQMQGFLSPITAVLQQKKQQRHSVMEFLHYLRLLVLSKSLPLSFLRIPTASTVPSVRINQN